MRQIGRLKNDVKISKIKAKTIKLKKFDKNISLAEIEGLYGHPVTNVKEDNIIG